ncbi:MAG: hypothetical protein ABSC03_10805 [Verrucomicrobiota bacterium]|jgi:hypothetical protein
MNPQWHFNARRPCDRMRDSANDAFFTAESLENLSEALVREAIQNSLDAAQRDAVGVRQVTVRIRFVPNAPEQARQFLAGHFASARGHTRSCWPVVLARIAREAWRRCRKDELREDEFYCSEAQMAGICYRNPRLADEVEIQRMDFNQPCRLVEN